MHDSPLMWFAWALVEGGSALRHPLAALNAARCSAMRAGSVRPVFA
jgi:hypothetical protein